MPPLTTFTQLFIPHTFGLCTSPYEYFESFKAVLCYVAYVDDMGGPSQGRTYPSSPRSTPGTSLSASSASTSGSTSEGSTIQHGMEMAAQTIPMPDHPGAASSTSTEATVSKRVGVRWTTNGHGTADGMADGMPKQSDVSSRTTGARCAGVPWTRLPALM